MTEKRRPPSLDKLEARLRAARAKSEAKDGAEQSAKATAGTGFALRVGAELVASLIVGVGIGWLMDLWLGTAPWLLVVFFFLGAGAGIVNVYRAAMGMGAAVGWSEAGEKDEDDRPGDQSGD